MKKAVCALCAILMTLGCAAVSGGFVPKAAPLGIAQTVQLAAEQGKANTEDEFLLGSWVSYYPTTITSYEEQTRDLAESGMNWIFFPQRIHSASPSFTTWKTVNDLYAANHIKFPMDVSNVSASGIDETINLAKKFEACNSYYVADEPSAAGFASVSARYNEVLGKDPSRFPFVNLYPNYAGTSNLGGTYNDYVRGWISAVGVNNLEYLYFDHYPLRAAGANSPTYFSDAEVIRKAAFESGRMKTGGFTQMGWWNGMRKPTADEARWSVYSLLAYGMKSISHFNWVSPGYTAPSAGGEGMMDFVLTEGGQKTELYEPMQKLNWQVRQLGPTLMGIDCMYAYHSGTVPQGAAALPRNFLFTPKNNEDVVVSLFTSKDDSQKYIMVFNKSMNSSAEVAFDVDTYAGIGGVTWLKPDDFEDALPVPGSTLPGLAEINIPITGGTVTQTFRAGEARLYRLEGDVFIPEPVGAPWASRQSGIYNTPQTVELAMSSPNAEVYYTLDGSYPTKFTNKYTAPIRLGEDGVVSRHRLRCATHKGGEVSEVAEYDYFITDDTKNVAYMKPVTIENGFQPFNCTEADINTLNDGEIDPWRAVSTLDGQYGWATIDLGQEYMIEKLIHSAWHVWEFAEVIIQISKTPDFTSGVYTVYNNDWQNNQGQGAGVKEIYKSPNISGLMAYDFTPFSARYIRCFNKVSQGGGPAVSVWTEVMAYAVYQSGGENLTGGGNTWQAAGGGTWNISGDTVSQTEAYDAGMWNRSYTLSNKRFKNFMIEGVFKVNNFTAGQTAGYIGFGIYKSSVTVTQATANAAVYICVDAHARVFVYTGGGQAEIGPISNYAVNFSLGSSFRLRVVSIGDALAVYIDGQQLYYHRNAAFDRPEGYIALQAGTFALSVRDITLTDMDAFAYGKAEELIVAAENPAEIAVPKFTPARDILAGLPERVEVTDTRGAAHNAGVSWKIGDYDRTKPGEYVFYGYLNGLPGHVSNFYKIKAEARVYVRGDINKTDFHALIAKARTLDEADYTAGTWGDFILKLQAAEELDNDPFATQNAVGVTHFQLFDAMKALVRKHGHDALSAAVRAAEDINLSGYTARTAAVFAGRLAEAQAALADNTTNAAQADEAAKNLSDAVSALRPLTDRSALNSAIAGAEKFKAKDYVADSFAAFTAVLDAAKRAAADEELSQAAADRTAVLLEKAADRLARSARGCKSSAAAVLSLFAFALSAAFVKRRA